MEISNSTRSQDNSDYSSNNTNSQIHRNANPQIHHGKTQSSTTQREQSTITLVLTIHQVSPSNKNGANTTDKIRKKKSSRHEQYIYN